MVNICSPWTVPGIEAWLMIGNLPFRNLWHSHWKCPFIVSFPIRNGAFPLLCWFTCEYCVIACLYWGTLSSKNGESRSGPTRVEWNDREILSTAEVILFIILMSPFAFFPSNTNKLSKYHWYPQMHQALDEQENDEKNIRNWEGACPRLWRGPLGGLFLPRLCALPTPEACHWEAQSGAAEFSLPLLGTVAPRKLEEN